jgi:hypothetical protein
MVHNIEVCREMRLISSDFTVKEVIKKGQDRDLLTDKIQLTT